jgi:hypothetical protein
MRLVDAALSVLGLAVLLSLWSLSNAEAAAPEIVILKSSRSRHTMMPSRVQGHCTLWAIYTEYDLQGDLERGKTFARRSVPRMPP